MDLSDPIRWDNLAEHFAQAAYGFQDHVDTSVIPAQGDQVLDLSVSVGGSGDNLDGCSLDYTDFLSKGELGEDLSCQLFFVVLSQLFLNCLLLLPDIVFLQRLLRGLLLEPVLPLTLDITPPLLLPLSLLICVLSRRNFHYFVVFKLISK